MRKGKRREGWRSPSNAVNKALIVTQSAVDRRSGLVKHRLAYRKVLPMTVYLEKSWFKLPTPSYSVRSLDLFLHAAILSSTFPSPIFIIPRDSVARFAHFVLFFSSWEHSHMHSHSFPTRDFLKGSRTVPEICSRFLFLLFSSLSIFIQLLVSFLRPSRKTKNVVPRCFRRISHPPRGEQDRSN